MPWVFEAMLIFPIQYPRPYRTSFLSISNIVVPAKRYAQGEQESVILI